MFRYLTLGRRTALTLALLALLALGTTASAPRADAAWTGPNIRVVTIDAHTLRVYGSGFTSLGRVHYWAGEAPDTTFCCHIEGWLSASQTYFGCTRTGCYSGGGTFTQDIPNLRCGIPVTLSYIDMATSRSAYGTYAAPC